MKIKDFKNYLLVCDSLDVEPTWEGLKNYRMRRAKALEILRMKGEI